MRSLSDETYTSAQNAAKGLRAELESLLTGKPHKGMSCCCGRIKLGPAKAVGVSIGGSDIRAHDFAIADPIFWDVHMKEDGRAGDYHYSLGLSEFLGYHELGELFRRHFAGLPLEARIGQRMVWMRDITV